MPTTGVKRARYLTVNGKNVQVRGTCIKARTYLDHLNPDTAY